MDALHVGQLFKDYELDHQFEVVLLVAKGLHNCVDINFIFAFEEFVDLVIDFQGKVVTIGSLVQSEDNSPIFNSSDFLPEVSFTICYGSSAYAILLSDLLSAYSTQYSE